MAKKANKVAVPKAEDPQAQHPVPVNNEYARCVTDLNRAGILRLLPQTQCSGVVGIDGKEYPLPTGEQVAEIFVRNRKLVQRKVPQGFARLALAPLAMPLPGLIDLLTAAIIKHAAAGKIFQARRSAADPHTPVRVNKEKQVWLWEGLRTAIATGELVYFPQEYSSNHRGQTKAEVIHDGRRCAWPGWSVGLVESSSFMPGPGQGRTLGGRRQLATGCSPNEYLHTLQAEAYQGETGITLEDFLTKFLIRLETTNEVSNDVDDSNAVWCLAHYLKVPYAQLVPTGRWLRKIGRARLDMHRTNNKLCTRSWGGSTTVRLIR